MERFEDAAPSLQKAIALDQENLGAYLALGILYEFNDKKKEVLALYKKALRVGPMNSAVNFYIGAACDRLWKRQMAENFLKRAIRFDDKNAEAYNYLGYMYAEDGRNLDEAIDLINKALRLDQDNGAYIDSLGGGRILKKACTRKRL